MHVVEICKVIIFAQCSDRNFHWQVERIPFKVGKGAVVSNLCHLSCYSICKISSFYKFDTFFMIPVVTANLADPIFIAM